MKEETRQNLVRGDIWIRVLYMILFAVAYSIAEAIIVFLAILQCVAVLITGHVNEPLLRFGKNLSVFVFDILEFQTFNTELKPFPFAAWPDEEPGGDDWLGDTVLGEDLDTVADEPVDAREDLKAEFDAQLNDEPPLVSGADIDEREADADKNSDETSEDRPQNRH